MDQPNRAQLLKDIQELVGIVERRLGESRANGYVGAISPREAASPASWNRWRKAAPCPGTRWGLCLDRLS
jgi:hypothetical protein